jgi:hypothetical protein
MPDVVGAARQMEKCEECRKGNVKQKVGRIFPATSQHSTACTPKF